MKLPHTIFQWLLVCLLLLPCVSFTLTTAKKYEHPKSVTKSKRGRHQHISELAPSSSFSRRSDVSVKEKGNESTTFNCFHYDYSGEKSHDRHHHIMSRRETFQNTSNTMKIIGAVAATSTVTTYPQSCSAKQVLNNHGELFVIEDLNTYSALVYVPKGNGREKYPVIFVLHGAGENTADIWNLGNINGEHAGLIPSLLNSEDIIPSSSKSTANAPKELYDNFIVITPYSYGKSSLYDEPRSKILQFVKWVCNSSSLPIRIESNGVQDSRFWNGKDMIDQNRLFLFGFSDGATLGVELMTTNIFSAGIIASYGFTGELPPLALERLKNKRLWVFHSADDVIYPVSCSDRLVQALRSMNRGEKHDDNIMGGGDNEMVVRYSRFHSDQEGFKGNVRGHSTGITASKDKEVYEWLLSLETQ